MGFKIVFSIIVLLAVSACTQSTQSAKPGAPAEADMSAPAADSDTFTALAAIKKSPKFYDVVLDPKEQQGTVKVKSPAQGWNKGSKQDGYVGFDVDESGLITFIVKHETKIGACTGESGKGSDDEEKADWVISRISVSAYGNTAQEKGNSFDAVQPAWIKEAFPAAPVNSKGEVSGHLFQEGPGLPGRTYVGVYNANAQYGYKNVFYEVELRKCSDNSSATTDPMVGNGGRKSL